MGVQLQCVTAYWLKWALFHQSSSSSVTGIREMCGTDDCHHAITYFKYFFGRFPGLDDQLEQ